MPWVKLSDMFPYDGKIIEAGKDGRLLYLYVLCYAAKELTDGFVPRKAVILQAALADVEDWAATAQRLVMLGLWSKADDGTGFFITNYLKYNPSRDEYHQYIAQRRDAGKLGGRPRKNRDAKRDALRDANRDGFSAPAKTEMLSEEKARCKAVPVPVPVPVSVSRDGVASGRPTAPTDDDERPQLKLAPARRSRTLSPVPDLGHLIASVEDWAAEKGLTQVLAEEAERFRNYCLSRVDPKTGCAPGSTKPLYVDYQAALRNWLTNPRYSARGRTKAASPYQSAAEQAKELLRQQTPDTTYEASFRRNS